MNIIDAIINLVRNPVTHLETISAPGRNRANNAGDALEEYVKDLFANSLEAADENERNIKRAAAFSYLGNNSNPPDAMLRGGDAIEIKKIETYGAAIALNSSYPKHTLKSSNAMLSRSCRNAEQWAEKDIIYAVGFVRGNDIKQFCMVYGLDYCASEECYSRISQIIKSGVESIPGVDFTETRELGHINRVDPLGITYMRIRGMWGIENPWYVFNYIYEPDSTKDFNFMCIINNNKWKTLSNTIDLVKLVGRNKDLSINNVLIKDPDNTANLVEAKLITFSI